MNKHISDTSKQAYVNHGEDSLTVTSLRPIPAGTEILNYYGPLGNGDLLRRYGYVTSRHSRYDVTEISWDLIMSVLKDTLKIDEATWGKAVCVLSACLITYSGSTSSFACFWGANIF